MNRLLFLCVLFYFSISFVKAQKITHSLYLIGDSGDPETDAFVFNFHRIQQSITQSKTPSTVLFLGDNVYPKGIPDSTDSNFEVEKSKWTQQLAYLKDLDTKIYVIPGNHDWQKGGKKGADRVFNQEVITSSLLNDTSSFFPQNGCPGPIELHVNHELLLVLFDSQWFLHPWTKNTKREGCELETMEEFLGELEDVLLRNKHKKVVLAAHHPLITYGPHGKYYPFKYHIFPLTDVKKNLYIPLPVIGSIYPLYRTTLGSIQDMPNYYYKEFSRPILSLLKRYPNTIYAAGHEHSLQYIQKDALHLIVSGSGSKITRVKNGKYSEWSEADGGYVRLDILDNGKVVANFVYGKDEKVKQFDLYQKEYKAPPRLEDFHPKDTVVFSRASEQYQKGSQWLIGENYRNVWIADRQFKVFDIGSIKGGLKIIKKGGGMQTKSLRLQDSLGRQYALRSVEKFATKAVPEELRGTLAAQVVQDQISASHPYAFSVVPYLADAAGVYHTNPDVYYVPDDPRFGPYRKDFANLVCLFEERPDDDMSHLASMGNTKKVYSTPKIVEKLQKDNDNHVDQNWVVKSRLFDMFLGDWDRHDDQWRWASFKDGKGKMYRPIPRDRDQVFFVNDGVLMWGASRKWAMPKFQGFDYNLKHVDRFNFNARYFDRDFMNEPSRDTWMSTADSLQQRLTDDVIENALLAWPEPIRKATGVGIANKLKAQRNNLKSYATEYYNTLAKLVNIDGSNKREYFRIDRINKDELKVTVYKKTKKSEVRKNEVKEKDIIYQRHFYKNETKEIRLYGLKGNDIFHFNGDGKQAIKMRIIGGGGEDHVVDTTQRKGKKKTILYDKPTGMEMLGKQNFKKKFKKDPSVNAYDRYDFKYNTTMPLVFVTFNRDDGFFPGGGFRSTVQGFRKEPFKSQHTFYGAVAIRTLSFIWKYTGNFRQVFGKWHALVDLDVKRPNFTDNFFGLGNETTFDKNISEDLGYRLPVDFYRVRYEQMSAQALTYKDWNNQRMHLDLGLHLQSYRVDDRDLEKNPRFIGEYIDSTGNQVLFDRRYYYGLVANFIIDTRDSKIQPNRGIRYAIGLKGYNSATDDASDFTSINSDFTFYITARLPAPLTWASRVGGGYNGGDYEFFQAQKLGGLSNLRGYRKTRFYGDGSFYFNNELRLRIAKVKTKVVPFDIGINGFYDLGRVWLKDEKSKKWHSGYGGGIWFTPINALTTALEVGTSNEDTMFYIRLGFLY